MASNRLYLRAIMNFSGFLPAQEQQPLQYWEQSEEQIVFTSVCQVHVPDGDRFEICPLILSYQVCSSRSAS